MAMLSREYALKHCRTRVVHLTFPARGEVQSLDPTFPAATAATRSKISHSNWTDMEMNSLVDDATAALEDDRHLERVRMSRLNDY